MRCKPALMILVLAGGCGLEGEKDGCEQPRDCFDGYACVRQVCVRVQEGPCDAARPCADGHRCFNGKCALECDGAAGCSAGSHCDTHLGLCAADAIAACPEAACAETQACYRGLCSASTAAACDPYDLDDGCPAESICLDQDVDSQPRCYEFPLCPASGICPVGTFGAVCNDGLFPDKPRMCLPGTCTAAEHCPAGWSCIKGTVTEPVGWCSDGTPGMPCVADGDCASNSCFVIIAGFPGACM